MNSVSNDNVMRAMFFMVSAMLIVPGMDALAKILATTYQLAPASVTMVRFLVQSALMFLVVIIQSKSLIVKAKNPIFNLVRGLLIASASMIFFISVKYMPIADAISIFFVEPIFVMFLSWVFLGETIGWRRIVAAVFGFSGALLVIQPSFEQFGLVSILPLCTAALFSFYLILTRKFGAQDNPINMQFYSGIGGVFFCGFALLVGGISGVADLQFTLPNQWVALGWMILIGVLASISHLLIVKAFSLAPASVLAPFQYVEIVSATLLGLIIFGDFPDATKWLGTTIIIASGLYIFWREQSLANHSSILTQN